MGRDPLTEGGDCRKDWRRINEVDADVLAILGENPGLQETISRRHRPQFISGRGLHPFKLYQYPWNLRDPNRTDAEKAKDWRRITVRSGYVIADTVPGISVTGTDGATYPNDGSLPGVGEFTAPADTAAYYVWVEVAYASSAWVANIRHAATPTTAATGENNPTPWSTWPAMDGHRYLIGVVDTNTNKVTREVRIRQFILGDILLGPIFNVCVTGTEKPYAIPGLAKGEL